MQSKLAKIGPWGGNGGDNKDVKKTPKKLLRITVYANSMYSSTPSVRGICFSYTSSDGNTYDEGPWGTTEGLENKVCKCSFSTHSVLMLLKNECSQTLILR